MCLWPTPGKFLHINSVDRKDEIVKNPEERAGMILHRVCLWPTPGKLLHINPVDRKDEVVKNPEDRAGITQSIVLLLATDCTGRAFGPHKTINYLVQFKGGTVNK